LNRREAAFPALARPDEPRPACENAQEWAESSGAIAPSNRLSKVADEVGADPGHGRGLRATPARVSASQKQGGRGAKFNHDVPPRRQVRIRLFALSLAALLLSVDADGRIALAVTRQGGPPGKTGRPFRREGRAAAQHQLASAGAASRARTHKTQRPLSPQKRTFDAAICMSALCQ
jgi:hypothetical protein